MNNPPPCKTGDIGDVRSLTLGGVLSLVGATAVAYVKGPNRGDASTELVATITDTVARTVDVVLGTAVDDWLPSLPDIDTYRIEVEVTFGDGSVLTFPNDGYSLLKVVEQLG